MSEIVKEVFTYMMSPYLYVACPTCGAKVGVNCSTPTKYLRGTCHKSRRKIAVSQGWFKKYNARLSCFSC